MLPKKIKRIHFVGIGGTGMAALASLVLDQGYEVSGSDLVLSDVTDKLIQKGAKIFHGHHPNNVKAVHLVVTSTAIPSSNSELQASIRTEIPVVNRVEFLATLMKGKKSIAVAGSHGKSTTTSMIACLFMNSDLDPTTVIGISGSIDGSFENARLGKSRYFISEVDESNNAFLRCSPFVSVVLNIDDDHLDFHKTFDNLKESFLQFINSTDPSGISILSGDDRNIQELLPKVRARYLTFGLDEESDYFARNILLEPLESQFEVFSKKGGRLGALRLRIPGLQYVVDALSVVTVSQCMKIDFGLAAYTLENFVGARRRFERLAFINNILVVDDYAHHPTAIKACIDAAANGGGRRVRVIFQPHRYSRSKNLAEKFPGAFEMADEIVITDIYPAGEEPIEGIHLDYLYSFFRRVYSPTRIKTMMDDDEIFGYFVETMKPGDTILTVGAGDVSHIGRRIADYLNSRPAVVKDTEYRNRLFSQ